MAFDMQFSEKSRECIAHHEEYLFSLALEDEDRYPCLVAVWEAFYSGPRIAPIASSALVHELNQLLASNGGSANVQLAVVVRRLATFFEAAAKSGQEIRCTSD